MGGGEGSAGDGKIGGILREEVPWTSPYPPPITFRILSAVGWVTYNTDQHCLLKVQL